MNCSQIESKAIDIEKSIQELKNKIELISETPFDVEKDSDDEIVTKALGSIIKSLHSLIDHLKLEENPRIKDGLPKILKGKLKSNLKQLKDVTKVIGILHEIQYEGFELVVDNHKTFREQHGYYKMRSVLYIILQFFICQERRAKFKGHLMSEGKNPSKYQKITP